MTSLTNFNVWRVRRVSIYAWWETQTFDFDIEGCDECVDNSPCIASLNVVLRTILLVLQVQHHHLSIIIGVVAVVVVAIVIVITIIIIIVIIISIIIFSVIIGIDIVIIITNIDSNNNTT